MDLAFVLRKLRGYGSLLLSLISLFLVIVASSELLTDQPDGTDFGVLMGILVLFSATGLLTAHRAWRDLTAPAQPYNHHADIQAILQLAKAEQGCVTISEVSMHCELPIARTQTLLDELVNKGIAVIDVSEHGALLYRFPDFQQRQLHP